MRRFILIVAATIVAVPIRSAFGQQALDGRLRQEFGSAVSQQIQFVNGVTGMSAADRAHLLRTATLMGRFLSAELRVEYSSRDGESYAAAIKKYLTDRGVADGRITVTQAPAPASTSTSVIRVSLAGSRRN